MGFTASLADSNNRYFSRTWIVHWNLQKSLEANRMKDENLDKILETVLVPSQPPLRSQWRKLELALNFINKSKKSINQNKNNMSKNETMENSKKRESYNNTDWKKSAIIDTNKKDSINVNHFYNQNEKQFYG